MVAERKTLVPAIFWQEIAHPILKAVRGGRMTEARAREWILKAGRLPVRTLATGGRRGLRPLYDLAQRHGLSSYDATYLRLAMTRRGDLASFDRQLRRAAVAEGVGVIPAEFGG